MKLLVLGASSQLGRELVSLLSSQEVKHEALGSSDIDLLKPLEVARLITRIDPDQVINVASYTNLEKAERDEEASKLCDLVNTQGVSTLALACDHLNIPLIHHSSSYVFDGSKNKPYDEEDATNPQCRYGLSKWYGECAIRDVLKRHVILRTDWMFSVYRNKFFRLHIEACKRYRGNVEVMDHRFSPTPADDVARVMLAMARQIDCHADVWGTYHYCALLPQTQQQFVEYFLKEAARYDEELAACLENLTFAVVPVALPYIGNTVLNTNKIMDTFGIKQRSRAGAITRVLEDLYGLDAKLNTVLQPAPVEEETLMVSEPHRRGSKKKNGKASAKSKNAERPARTGAVKKSLPPP
ncbi:MAG: sugar nucleotide-binding protein [Pseudomonadales bacterium]|nr:sugar nucleotide-binding protein [Pseudomonadales bacterium]